MPVVKLPYRLATPFMFRLPIRKRDHIKSLRRRLVRGRLILRLSYTFPAKYVRSALELRRLNVGVMAQHPKVRVTHDRQEIHVPDAS